MSRVSEEKQAGPHDTATGKKKYLPNTFEGKLVSIIGNRLVVTNKEGMGYSQKLAEDVTLTFNGTVCQAGDLKAGSKIRVTTKQDDRRAATLIDSCDINGEFPWR
jgi:hypothetical protein